MKRYAVVGVGYGDEGKGTITDTLCSRDPYNSLVVRYSGGFQVGHTVKIDNEVHEFRHFGSGTLRGCPTYWKVVVFPPDFQIEREIILKKTKYEIVFYIDRTNPVTTVYDIAYNRTKDHFLQHGSTGKGIAATLQRNELISLTTKDLMFPAVVLTKLNFIKKYYEELIIKNGFSLEQFEKEIFINDSEFIKSCEYFLYHSTWESLLNKYSTWIYEGNQGLLLDPKIGFYPHVTYTSCKSPDVQLDEIFYVTRCYGTRHGNGPFHHEEDQSLINNSWETNHLNPYQGNFRTGYLDIDLVNYAILSDRNDYTKNNLVITCLDQLISPEAFYQGEKVLLLENLDKFQVNNIWLKSTPDSLMFLNK